MKQTDGDYVLGGKDAWYALIVIALSQALSMLDRQILAILIPNIKKDLGVGDAEMGLLYGTFFALFYALFSLPLGRLADGWNRSKQLGLSVLVWSGMTALAGTANSFSVLAVSRLGVGIGEASVQPAGFSFLSDVFPKKMRGTVAAIMAASVSVGLGAAVWFGGAVADIWNSNYAISVAPLGLRGWQVAFMAAAVPGIILGILLLRLREPTRGGADGIISISDPNPVRESFITLVSILPVFAWLRMAQQKVSIGQWLINICGMGLLVVFAVVMTEWTNSLRDINPVVLSIGSLQLGGNALQWGLVAFGGYVLMSWMQSLRVRDYTAFTLLVKSKAMTILIVVIVLQSNIVYAIMAWTPTYLINKFDRSPSEIGAVYGAMVMLVGIIGPVLAGPMSDWLQRKHKSGRLFVFLFAVVGSSMLASFVYSAETLFSFYLRFSLFSLILTMWLPAVYASLMDLVLPRIRGAAISYYILTATIFGLGMGPYLVGLINDSSTGDLGSAIVSFFWMAPFMIVLLVVLVWVYAKDVSSVVSRAKAAGEQCL